MNTRQINSEKSKTSDRHKLTLNLRDKIRLKIRDKYLTLSNLSICFTWENIKKLLKNSKSKTLVPMLNNKIDLPDRSNSVSDIQLYFDYVINKCETPIDNPRIRICVNKIENRVTFKLNTG